MRRPKAIRFLLVVVLCLGSTPITTAASPSSKPVIYAVNYPLQYFASRIAGDLAQVEFPAPANVDPAFWIPDEATLLKYQQADLILLNGANYAHWLTTISLPINRMINTTQSIADQYIYAGEVVSHTHGPTGEHSHESLASTTWLDMNIAAEQARSIARALIHLMPEQKDTLTQNLITLVEELDHLDIDLQTISATFGKNAILASHPVYQYFSSRYRFNMQSVHWEPEEVQPEAQWQQLEVLLEKHPAKWMIWEGPPLPETSDGLSGLGVTPLVFYILSNQASQGDFISVMRQNVETLKRIIEHM